MRNLFNDLYRIIRKSENEFAVVFEIDGKRKAITCDKVHSIIKVNKNQFQKADTLKQDEFVKGIYQADSVMFAILNDNVVV